MEPSPWDPKGGAALGRITGRMALNGFALIFDYEQERNGVVTFTGHGVYTYDPKEDLYTLSWFDCMGVPPEIFKGKVRGRCSSALARRRDARASDLRPERTRLPQDQHGNVRGR